MGYSGSHWPVNWQFHMARLRDHREHRLAGHVLATCAVWIAAFAGCAKPAALSPAEGRANSRPAAIDIWCTSWPLYAITRELVGDDLRVDWLEPPGGFDPAERRSWFPSDEQLAAVQQARLLVDNGPGAPYAWWTGMTSLSEGKVCNSTVDFGLDDFIPVREMQITHSHGPGGEHSHDYLVPFVWHDPALAAKQVRAIAARLAAEWPELGGAIEARAGELLESLDQADSALKIAGQRLDQLGPVVLATPDLRFAARGLGLPRVGFKLWAADADEAGWRDNFFLLPVPRKPNGAVSVLFAGKVPDAALHAAKRDYPALQLIAIDMLEQGSDGDTVAGRLQGIARAVEAACDEAGR